MKNIIKKVVTIGLSLAIGSLLLSGCNSGGNTDNKDSSSSANTEKQSADDSTSTDSQSTSQNSDAVSDEPMQLNILNWGDYIDDTVLADFEAEYPNIAVSYEVMSSNEEMLTLLQGGGAIYDICFPSDYTIAKLLKLDLLQPIDKTKLSNLENIDPAFLDLSFDPGNEYSIPYHWGTLGILYNNTMVNEPVDSWSILWDSRYKKQIFMYDSVRDSMAIALLRMDDSINTIDTAQINAAADALIQQKPLVQAYGIDDLRDKMISGAGSFAVVYSGDAVDAISQNSDLAYVVPDEGSNIWYDNVVITKNSTNTEAAHIFINYLLRPDVAAKNAEYIGYSTPNKAALELLPAELVDDPTFNPPEDVRNRCEMFEDIGDAMTVYNEAWLRVKAAN